MHDNDLRAFGSQDERLQALLDQLIRDIAHSRPARRRAWTPGANALAAMTMRRLVRETVLTYVHGQADQSRRELLADEFDTRGFPDTAAALRANTLGHPQEEQQATTAFEATIDGINDGFDAYFAPGEFADVDNDKQPWRADMAVENNEDAPDAETIAAAYAAVNVVLVADVAGAIVEQEAADAAPALGDDANVAELATTEAPAL